ncbi:MAG: molybdate ABC transporter substrate-binding protein [Armatimonadota bacterium]
MHRRQRHWYWLILACALAAGGILAARAARIRAATTVRPLLLYCAAALKPAVERVAAEYTRTYGIPIRVQYGASGMLLSNIKVSQQGDLFLPADESFLVLGEQDRLIGRQLPLVRMTPVMVVARGNPLNIMSLEDVMRRSELKIACANPEAASIGKVVREALQRRQLWAPLERRITVMLPTVTDVANAVKLGTVDAGIVWDAVAKQYPDETAVPVPVLAQATQRVSIAVVTTSTQPDAAWRFARYLGARDKGLRVFNELGYNILPGEQWKEQR